MPRLEAEYITDLPLRHAVEFRHEGFAAPESISLLRRNKIALAVADTPEWPCLMDVTADFVYCRLHGSKKLYSSGYDAAAIETWARRAVAWLHGKEVTEGTRIHSQPAPKRSSRDVFIYFDNDAKVRAPGDVQSAMKEIAMIDGSMRFQARPCENQEGIRNRKGGRIPLERDAPA